MLYRFALVVAVCALILIASGAVITSNQETAGGQSTTRAGAPDGIQLHRAMGMGAGALVAGLAVWLFATKRRALQALAAAALTLGGADAWVALGAPLTPELAALHAWLAPVFFASLAAAGLFTSPGWSREPDPVDDRGLRFLRPLAIGAPPLVLLQTVLGAMYRHKLASVMWHMAGAMLVSLATLVACMIVMQQYPEHRALKNSAIGLMTVVLVQVSLGVAAFTMQLLETENTLALALVTVSHVVTGNLTLAASLIFAAQVQRNVRPGAAAP